MNRERCKKAIECINPTRNFNERTINYINKQIIKENRRKKIIKLTYAGAAIAACIAFAVFALPKILGTNSQPSEQSVAVLETQGSPNTSNVILSKASEKPSPSGVNNNETIRNISTVDKIKMYTSSSELLAEASDVFTGICISACPVFQNETLYTLAEYRVSETFKGELKTGDVILLVEVGGVTTYGDYAKYCVPEKKPGDGNWEDYHSPDDKLIDRAADGAYVSKVGDEVLLFAGDTSGFLKSVTEPLYGVIGDIDGKFYKQSEGVYARALPASTDQPIFTGDKKIFGDAELVIYLDELR